MNSMRNEKDRYRPETNEAYRKTLEEVRMVRQAPHRLKSREEERSLEDEDVPSAFEREELSMFLLEGLHRLSGLLHRVLIRALR